MIRKEDVKKMLDEMIFNFGISPLRIADKMRISFRTLERWRKGETEPRLGDKFYLRQIYNGYCKKFGIRRKK